MAVVMVMIAMLVMVMVIVVLMTVLMTAMGVRRMIVPRMVMCFACRRGRMAAAGIGSAFRIERRFDLDNPRAQPLHHRLDDMIAPDPQASCRDLCRQMAVSEMPGDPNQMLRVVAADLRQRLRHRHDFDQPAIVEHQRVTTPQRHRMFQIEQKRESARAGHRHPPPVTIVEIEHDGIGRRLAPAMRPANLRGADHSGISSDPGFGKMPAR